MEEARRAGWEGPGEQAQPSGPPQPQPPEWLAEATAAGWVPAGQMPPQAPPPAETKKKKGLSRGAVFAVAAAAVLVIVAGAGAAIVAVSGSDKDPTINRGAFIAPKPRTQTLTTVTAPEKNPSPSSSSGALVTYDAGTFKVGRPAGWTVESDKASHDGYFESRWRSPADSNTSVTVDWTPGGNKTSAYSNASGVRAQTMKSAGYREVAFKDTNLAGKRATMWVFDVSGDRRVDYFINGCGNGFAVLGSTSPSNYAAQKATFRKVARSLALYIDKHC